MFREKNQGNREAIFSFKNEPKTEEPSSDGAPAIDNFSLEKGMEEEGFSEKESFEEKFEEEEESDEPPRERKRSSYRSDKTLRWVLTTLAFIAAFYLGIFSNLMSSTIGLMSAIIVLGLLFVVWDVSAGIRLAILMIASWSVITVFWPSFSIPGMNPLTITIAITVPLFFLINLRW